MEHLIYCAGKFIDTPNTIEVINPYDGRVVSTTFLAGEEELKRAVNMAHQAADEMAMLPAFKKAEILFEIIDGLEREKRVFAEMIAKEAGKPWRYALGEVNRAIQTFTVAAEEAKRIPSEILQLDWTPAGEGREGLVKYFPVGPIGAISPFNFPLNLAVHKLAPALAAGCPVVLKPATKTPLATLELAKLIDKTSLPKGAVSILPMDRKVGGLMVKDEGLKMLTFTGSPEVGWMMKQNCGKKKIALELGGNAGVIITPTADIGKAIERCVFGAFAYSGQVCIHAQRIWVHDAVYDHFVKQFVEKTKALVLGDPMDEATEVSVMIDDSNAQRVEEWIRLAVKDGAEVLAGGERKGRMITPTVLTNTRPGMHVCAKEVFGPVVTIEKYTNFQNAIREVNNSKYGLQAGVFTDSISEMNAAHNYMEVGGVIINDVPTFRVDHMPYGGVKDSGVGREGVKYAIREMMEPRILVKNK